ncbi:hypothetical protein GCM10028790_51050 [Micromonospora taraxaci]|uniref:Uncharacterized protein n=1 Tax=Micromonospora taraxaci TaxID=1316803 RepID=A0A561VX44_9ACTN|nr:hypothetical protein [Micromonospora taraxaci]TWG16174.1 hypothetical protein FHU34_111500 [Micromonospora taraxaci]
MSAQEPPEAATQDAVAMLLHLAFMEIRLQTSPLTDEQSPEALARRVVRINELADLCHSLPGYLAPERRDRAAEGLRYVWRVSAGRRRNWLRSRLDHLGYDYGWLDALDVEEPAIGHDGPSVGQ